MGNPDKSRFGLKGRTAEWTAIAVLFLLPFVVYFPVTIGYATFAGFDHTGINQPLKHQAFSAMRSGDLPLWEHRLDRGLPLLAEGEAGIFYPLNLLFFLPGDFLTIYNFVLLLCLVTAGLLFYWWVRRLGVGSLAAFLAATAHQWGATVNFNKANMNILEGFILAPLLMLLIEPTVHSGSSQDRPLLRTAGIACVLAAMIFAGQAQYVIYTGLFALVYIILRVICSGRFGWKTMLFSMGVPFVLGIIIGIGLAAVQLFSTLELIPLSERGSLAIGEGFSIRGLWLSPGRLFATYIFPAYHYSLDHFLPYLSTTIYIGPVAILLAGYALRFRNRIVTPALIPLLIAGLIFLYLAMGANAPLAGELTSFGPLAHFRGHGRLGGYFAMAMIALMGMGLDALLNQPCMSARGMVERRKYIPLFIIELGLMALLAIPFITRRAEFVETRTALGLMLGFLLIFFAGLLVGNLVRSRTPIAVAVALTLVMQIIGFQATSSESILARSSWESDRADLLYVRDNADSPVKSTMFAIRTQASVRLHERIIRRGLAAFEGGSHRHIDHLGSANAGLMEDLIICNADLPLELARWEWLVHQRLWPMIDSTEGLFSVEYRNLLWILGVNWIVTENARLEFPVIESYDEEIPVYERLSDPEWCNRDIPYYIYQRESPVAPHAVYWDWTGTPIGASEETVREAFFDYLAYSTVERVVFIEDIDEFIDSETDAVSIGTKTQATRGEWVSRTEYRASVNVSVAAIFVLRDAWYPGWEVYVNGEPAELLRADLVYKGVKIPPGRNEIVFMYRPTYLMAGWCVSGICFLVIIGLIAVPVILRVRKIKLNGQGS